MRERKSKEKRREKVVVGGCGGGKVGGEVEGRSWSVLRSTWLSGSSALRSSSSSCPNPPPSLILFNLFPLSLLYFSSSTHFEVIMLEAFEILTTSGVVLWSKSYAPVGAHVINSLINDVFIEEKVVPQNAPSGSSPVYKKEKYTLKWRRSKESNLIFVVRSLSHFILLCLISAQAHIFYFRLSTNHCST